MRIVLTGVSSFTGAWFAQTLAERGHDVIGTLQRGAAAYEGVHAARLAAMRNAGVTLAEGVSFGSDAFQDLVGQGLDVLCHHAAFVTDYRSADFDVAAAVEANTRQLRHVLARAVDAGAKAFVATGSVFEQDEGAGEDPLRAFSPYGLSKGLTWQIEQFWAERLGLPVGKFVIPNPFGPLEEPRFCAYLMRTWTAGKTAEVKTPAYVRDNIPVDLLARAYADFVEGCVRDSQAVKRLNPSGYVESQGAFAQRFAREIGGRLSLDAGLVLCDQTEFEEPVMRVNTEMVRSGWNETASWDALAAWYRTEYLS
jgi:UDP-glucose 4-epimerase